MTAELYNLDDFRSVAPKPQIDRGLVLSLSLPNSSFNRMYQIRNDIDAATNQDVIREAFEVLDARDDNGEKLIGSCAIASNLHQPDDHMLVIFEDASDLKRVIRDPSHWGCLQL